MPAANDAASSNTPAQSQAAQVKPFSSPIPPRFRKSTERGAKRNLTIEKYEIERKRQKKETMPGIDAGNILTTDQWIYRQIKHIIAPRFIALSKGQLDICLKKKIPEMCNGNMSLGVTRDSIANNVDILGYQYYKFYRQVINKARSACYVALAETEIFFDVGGKAQKLRGKAIRGRDLWRWYEATDDIAKKLEKIVRGEGDVVGFRAGLLKSYNELLANYDMNEGKVTPTDYIRLVKAEPFFVIMAVACNKNSNLYDTKLDLLEDFDVKLRPSIEALIIHAWYCDLWDVDITDEQSWNDEIIGNIKTFVLRDRKTVSTCWSTCDKGDERAGNEGDTVRHVVEESGAEEHKGEAVSEKEEQSRSSTTEETTMKLNAQLLRRIITITKPYCDYLPMYLRHGIGHFNYLVQDDEQTQYEDNGHEHLEDSAISGTIIAGPYNPDEDESQWM